MFAHLIRFIRDQHRTNDFIPLHVFVFGFIAAKRSLVAVHAEELKGSEMQFLREPHDCCSNHWLNAVILNFDEQRDALIKTTNDQGVMPARSGI